MGYIYQITNTETNKRYIGQTKTTLERRLYEHAHSGMKGSTTHLHRSIAKHGKDVFTIVSLEEVQNTELKSKEKQWIAKEKPEYNMTGGGEGCGGFWITDGIRSFRIYDLSKIPDGFRRGRDSKTKDNLRGKRGPMSSEHKAKISVSCQNPSAETRAKISASLSGRTPTQDHKDKISKALKGKVVSLETRAKISAAGFGRQHSDETRLKMSLSHKAKI